VSHNKKLLNSKKFSKTYSKCEFFGNKKALPMKKDVTEQELDEKQCLAEIKSETSFKGEFVENK